ncbi:MAG: N-acetylglucosaminyldiphosphoundecaprenol N-acetyl-beta-D-mannosaminyltransferase [Anaerolineae bacterium]|nr:N-acetylglucosaminyldiphosphoundecaprenol N-acetyl-beta-D-mannosaminyltransferase [Anaerolineae bacterium]RIK34598.1 MAG: acetylglucosaminyldiphospho-UDP acetyl-beta-D-mannosaminyltransferase [Chloroflexota bacterium]
MMNSITLLNVRVDDVTMGEALAQCDVWMQEPRLHQLVTVNPEFIMTAQKNPDFAATLAASDLNLPDGANLVRAAEWQKTPVRERVAGTDFVWYFCSAAAICGWKIFLLGGRAGVGQAAAARLQARYPKLNIVGVYEGSPAPTEESAITARIRASDAEVLFVAYGAPAQDLWIRRNRAQLSQIRIAVGVGGAFDYIAQRVKRAPLWMQKSGLEWTFRLLMQPWRAKRQAALAGFLWQLWRQKTPPKNSTLQTDG